MNLKRVAVNDAGLSDKIFRQGRARQQDKHQDGSDSVHVDHFTAGLSKVARIEFRPVLEQLERWQILGPLRIVKLRATQPAAFGPFPEQDRIHLPGELIDPPHAVILNDFAGRIERQAVQPAESIDLMPVFADVAASRATW
jgi:hypothetical protein